MLLAAEIGVVGGNTIVLTDVPAGSENNVSMDFQAGVLTISDTTGLTGDATLAPYIVGDTLSMTAAQLFDEGISDIVLDTGDENDTIRIKGTPDSAIATSFTGQTTVEAGSGNDTVVMGSLASLDNIASLVEVNGGAGDDELELLDFAGTADPLVTITGSVVSGLAPADIAYADVETLVVDVVDASPTSIAIESTTAATEVRMDSGADETITFGVAGDMSGIQGPVLLNDFFGGGDDLIIYDDSAYAGGRSYTLAADGSLQATGIADITVSGGVFEAVRLLAGGGDDTIDLAAGSTTTFDIDAGGGSDAISVAGETGADKTVNIAGGLGNDTFQITGSPDDTLTINVDGGGGNDTFNVTVLSGSTTAIDLVGGAGTDTLNIDISATTDPQLEVIPTATGGVVEVGFTDALPVTFREIENVDITGLVDELAIREDLSPDFVDGAADTITLSRVGARLDVNVNGVPQIRVELAAVAHVTVEGSGDNDTLVVENSGGLVNQQITFHGNGQTSTPGDTLVVQGDPGSAVARETYLVGATRDAGTVVLDPDDSAGPGAAGTLNGDELVITFTGLEPIVTSTPAAIFDAILTSAVDELAVRNGLLPGHMRVVDLGATFETFQFANKTTARISGGEEADIFRVEYTVAAAGLATLELYGHLAPDIAGPADDDASESVVLHSTDAITTSVYTQGGSDVIEERDDILNNLQGIINVVGGESTDDNDYLRLQDIADAGPDTVTITAISITGAAPATINYDEIEKLFFESTAGDDVIDVLSTAAGTETFVTGSDGNDIVTVGNQTADFGVVFDGSLDGVQGPLAISGDFSATDGEDTLNVDDSGTGSLAGAATIDVDTYTFDLTGVGTSWDGPVTVLDGFAPAPIRYFHDTIDPLGLDPRLEYLNVLASAGDDDITVQVTTAINTTWIDSRGGTDLITVTGDGLSAVNVFAGGDDADELVLNVTTNLGDASFVDLMGLEIAGNDPAATTAERDRLTINDLSGAARELVFDYLDSPGALDILPGAGGGLGAGAEDIPVLVRTMETVVYEGSGSEDVVSIDGTSGDDALTVAPLAGDVALVFLGGNPWDGPADPQAFADALPGVAGGGSGPDLLLVGLDATPGLIVNDDAGTNQLFIYGLTDGGLSDGTAVDHFGFGAGQILPDPSNVPYPNALDAYDNITVTDTVTVVNGYIPVRYDTTDFAQAVPAVDRAIIINAGSEANPPATLGVDVADNITLTPSANYLFQINGGDPDPVSTGIVPPDGDRLNVVSPTSEIDIYSDKSIPPNVSVSLGGVVLPFQYSSIENLSLDANGGTVNLIGDNNGLTPQHDNFVVLGKDIDGDPSDGGYQEVEVMINGSGPIYINNVQFLNAYGLEETDTLEVTPYADNTPRGWGVDVRFDEGNPVQDDGEQVDLLIFHTALGVVSEDIVIQASGAEHGELRVTNGAFGTPIVTISYINNLDIIVIDSDGGLSDTDTLTLRGTNPDNLGTSGQELVVADFTAAGDLANPLVVVEDLDPVDALAPILYRVRDIVNFHTVTIDTQGGSDMTFVTGRDDGSMAVNVLNSEMLALPLLADEGDTVVVVPGTSTDAGTALVSRATASLATAVHFDGTVGILIDGGGGSGFDVVAVDGTPGDDLYTVKRDSLFGDADVETSFGPTITAANLGSDESRFLLRGLGGDDDFSVEALDAIQVSVFGGDPTASDHVVVKGTPADDAIVYAATGVNSGEVTVNALAPVLLSDVELVTIDALAGSDQLTVETGAGDNIIAVTPGATADAGTVQVDSLLPMQFTNLGAGGMLALVDGAGAADRLIYNGTAATDSFTVGASMVLLNSRVPVVTGGIENYQLRGLEGDDSFTIQSQVGIDILVEGDGPGGSDTLNFAADGTGGDPVVVVELDSDLPGVPFRQTIQQIGFGVITQTGVESVNMDIEGGDLYVAGTRGEDVITFQPLSQDSGVLTADHIATTYLIDDVPATSELRISGGGTGRGGPEGGGFADKVVVLGTNGRDLLRVDAANRRISLDVRGFGGTQAWRAVTLDDGSTEFGTAGIVEVVEVRGRDGDDTIHVAPASPVGDGLFVLVDGGAARASDALVITGLDGSGNPQTLAADIFVVVAQSRTPDAGNVLVFENAVALPSIAYENVELVSPNVDSGDNLLILGPDMHEQNEYRQTAAYLGSGQTINVQNLAIFPNADAHPGVPADQDYFRLVAQSTGILDVQVYFHMYDTALLPAGGDLDVEVLDAAGNVIAGGGDFGTHDDTADARVRIPAVAGQTYYLHVYGAASEVINGYDLTVTHVAPPVPYDIELVDEPVDPDYDATVDPPADNSDTGRSHHDNVTADNSPAIIVRLDDSVFLNDGPNPPDEAVEIPFNDSTDPASTAAGYRVAIYVEGDPQQPGVSPQTVIGYAQPGAEPGVYVFDFNDAIVPGAVDLADGSHFISARVEIIDPSVLGQRGFGGRSDSLEIVVDTQVPPVDLAITVEDEECPFAPEGVTRDTTPGFYGTAEANAVVRFYVDIDGDGALQIATDFYLGETVALPYDGNNQFPGGYFEFVTPVGLNDEELLALGLPEDGLRTIFATAEDLAGNVTPEEDAAVAEIFLDTESVGPQITAVFVTSEPAYDLFNPKPSEDGPTPLVNSLTIRVQDLAVREAPFLYEALVREIAEHPGHYHLVGDANGIIPIAEVVVTLPTPADGTVATGTIELVFYRPLPDDRYTLTVSDALIDPMCNHLDGEANADEPQEDPIPRPGVPTGDGIPGGDFVARFTVDSRPEVGVWAAGNIWVDTNGNFVFDPENLDFTNRDIVYQMGYTSDNVFAGNFVTNAGAVADGFDKLAVYGKVNGHWRWLIDTDNDGVADIEHIEPLAINGLPVAGNFDGNAANGDEVAVFTGTTWYFDTDHDFLLNANSAVTTAMRGYPIVGDFNGDGQDDLATWSDGLFQVDLTRNGVADVQFQFGYIGVRAKPVAADMNMDGYDDFGLWLPDRSGVLPRNSGEWQFLVSEDPANPGVSMSVLDRIDVDPISGKNRVSFTPVPFGPDMFAQFGDDYALPVVGNFDPPVAGSSGGGAGDGSDGSTGGSSLHTNLANRYDVNDDGYVSPLDVLMVIHSLNLEGGRQLTSYASTGTYYDVNMDGYLSPLDALALITYLNAGGGEGEGGQSLVIVKDSQRSAGTASVANDSGTVVAAAESATNDAGPVGDADAEGEDDAVLWSTLELDDSADELALLVGEDGDEATDEFFRRLGDV